MHPKNASFLLLASLLFWGIGCSVGFNFHGGSRPDPNLKSIAIYTFPNEAPVVVPSLSQDFTEALRDRFLSQSNLSLTEGDADVEVSGSITGYRIAPIAIQGNETAAQNQLTISVRVKYDNHVNPSGSWEKSFSSFTNFDANTSISSVETELIETINEQLTQDIFNESLGKW